MPLHRFWFKFKGVKLYDSLRIGCGVTAHDYNDALAIMRETVFASEQFPPIEDVIEDVDISTLDQRHVIPNMEPPVFRGVWFPKGYLRVWPNT